ncbi:MAG TPA: ATP-binding cassette domain-containing protein [Candidatus Dormibacteraeota bacterium]|nr:ATP-binding cassette domain-containing protein [Candidatus Dormibacteraeota bacterium]
MTEPLVRPEPAVRASGVMRIYPGAAGDVAALRGLDIEVRPGEVVAVVGASGSGKSTLLRILAGLDRPSAGSVESLGVGLERATERQLVRYRNDVGVIDQQYWRALSPYLTARAAIELPLRLRGWSPSKRATRAMELLEQVGLADRGDATPSRLSGGEQQRVAFAAALAPRPRFLLADEPTAELDERTAAELVALLQALVRREGTTAIVVTHDRLVEGMADRIVYVRDGRAIAVRNGPDAEAEPVVDASGWRAPALPPPAPAMERVEPAAGTVPAVVIEQLSRTYGSGSAAIHAVRDLDATFASGGLHIVTGPSGSGKSTLLRLVAGLDRPTSGRVTTLGTDLAGLSREALATFRARDVAFCPQAPRLVPFLSALENVELALAIRRAGESAAARLERARDALAQVGLQDLASEPPETLSGGERVRVAIARAVAAGPRLLMLDEPTAALDRASATSLIAMLARLDRANVTLLVATHDRDLIAAASDRLDLRDARRG